MENDELDIALEQMRSYARPMELVAKAIYEDRNGPGAIPWRSAGPSQHAAYRRDAKSVIAVLKSHGFLSDLGIAALKAEEVLK